ncbi:carboxyl-terminal protease [Lentisphaera araneosa HTCC2155]|uniref:Carboxyl-terminal protease n=1 Tax=Lentisphaera araneosa HTCC2155 TaxID=313628 RepID=A6DH29_9BACT|nr:S41 family peptidase [Lentisphaera araneosa]EDM28912.1 carboxyl-terminal protease [Lentisphaera araneosa HTCC2155]
MIKKLLLLVTVINLAFGAYYYYKKNSMNPKFSENFYLLEEASDKLKSSYVDESKVGNEDLTKGALKGMLKGLDPYSTYYTPSQNKDQEEDLKGKFAGVGILFRVEDDGVYVRKVYEDSPAEKAGVQGGDYVVQANEVSLVGLDSRGVVGELKGEPGSKLDVHVIRGEDKLTLTLERGYVSVPTIKLAKMLDDEIAYMYISQFGASTSSEFRKKIGALTEAGMKGLILDLRFNGGGYLNSAVGICSVFLEYGSLVAYKEGRDADREDLLDMTDESLDHIPLVVLVNEDSASASEVTAACLRDYERCILVGEKTFGKGSVQVITQLSNGGSIRFTIAKYFTPGGYIIHGKGLDPDVEVELNSTEKQDLSKQISNYSTVDSEDPKDKQFVKAYEALQVELQSSRTKAPFFVELTNDEK